MIANHTNPISSRPMRYLLPVLAVAALVVTGCEERQNMRAVPNRELHAAGEASKLGDAVNKPIAGRNEQYYTLQSGDTVYAIAKKFNVTTAWLIKRNDIRASEELKPGNSLIVPAK
jgi:LysM repeat protein